MSSDRRPSRRLAHLAWIVTLPLWLGCSRGQPPRHLVLVTVDTLRADHVGAYGRPGLTPALDRLAAESVVFRWAFAAAPFTLASVSAIMTARFPEDLGIYNNDLVLPPETPTLATRLRAHGFRTGAVVSNWILREAAGLNVGFDAYDARYAEREAFRNIPERTAVPTTDAALAMLERLADGGSGRVFLWVHYQDPHGPYLPPGDLRARHLADEQARPEGRRELPVLATDRGLGGIHPYQYVEGQREVAFYRAGYDGEVQHTDAEIGRLLEGIRRRLPPAETVLVVTADHGESLGELDYWFSHGETLSEGQMRVPLIVRIPGDARGVRDDVVATVDLLPTLLHALGVDDEAGGRGRDLRAGAGRSVAYLAALDAGHTPAFGLVGNGRRYVVSYEPEKETLTPLGDETPERDPSADELRARRSELAALRTGLARAARASRQALSADDRQRLRALGYLTD
jgi:arylsulfatase A-like enzyme